MSALDAAQVRAMANAVRALAIDAVEAAKSGHPGMPMGMADAATVLFTRHMRFDATRPDWPDRDRFILSAGHGSMLLYGLLHLLGSPDMTLDQVKAFRQLGSRTAGHPEYGHAAGIETTTGPLGQGIANAVGFAIAEARLRAEFGPELVDHRTFVIAGDGCLMEGISQEAIALAGHLKLNRLIVLWDDNGISIDGPISLSDSTDQRARFEASGWMTLACDGHDPASVDAALTAAKASDRPVLIACKTVIGFGSPKKAGTKSAHGEPLGPEEAAATKAALGWTHASFEIPADLLSAWRAAGVAGAAAREAWEGRLAAHPDATAFQRRLAGLLTSDAEAALSAHAAAMAAEAPKIATRAASQKALAAVQPHAPEMLGGSADLTGSNLTLVNGALALDAARPGGAYVYYGIREHGMAAAMNGVALHGGLIPFGGTFLCFADYSRPAIRLAALMGVRVVHVMTHDSIGLGEDGPTHQPVEHLASLRAMPNLLVMRPADAVETAECWAVALAHRSGPSLLALSRQAVPSVRTDASQNLSARGAYVLAEAEGAKATLFATGTEVSLALEARELLASRGIPARVVSVPSMELFSLQDDAWQTQVIGTAPVRAAIEAGVRMGWDRFIGTDGVFVGMTGYGASGPAPAVYKHFGITAEALADAVAARIGA